MQRVRRICACLEIHGHTLVELTLESDVVASVRVNGADVITPCVTGAAASPILPVTRSPILSNSTKPSYPFNVDAFEREPTLNRICREASDLPAPVTPDS
jgi:hypothetical protein